MAREPDRARLTRAVQRDAAGQANACRVGGDRDDTPPTALAHAVDHGLRAVEDAVEVEADELVPLRDRKVAKRSRNEPGRDARVVHEHVDGSERALDVADDARDRVEVGHVGRHGHRAAAGAGDARRDRLRPIGHEVVHGDGRALRRQRRRDTGADALPGSGDERGAAVEVEHHRVRLRKPATTRPRVSVLAS